MAYSIPVYEKEQQEKWQQCFSAGFEWYACGCVEILRLWKSKLKDGYREKYLWVAIDEVNRLMRFVDVSNDCKVALSFIMPLCLCDFAQVQVDEGSDNVEQITVYSQFRDDLNPLIAIRLLGNFKPKKDSEVYEKLIARANEIARVINSLCNRYDPFTGEALEPVHVDESVHAELSVPNHYQSMLDDEKKLYSGWRDALNKSNRLLNFERQAASVGMGKEELAEQLELLETFDATQSIQVFSTVVVNGKYWTRAHVMYIDYDNKLLQFLGSRTGETEAESISYLVPFDSILDYDLITDKRVKRKSGLSEALIGNYLFGPTGAVVGAVVGKSEKQVLGQLDVNLIVNADSDVKILIHALDSGSSVEVGTTAYENSIRLAQKIMNVLDQARQADRPQSSQSNLGTGDISESETKEAASPPTQDPFNEIRRFKELLDEGIITEEEFASKKKSLLGL